MEDNEQIEVTVVSPVSVDQFFEYLAPDMQNYLVIAKKYSKQFKHYFIGVEHFFAAFLFENSSMIRRFINQPKLNWKKKINDFLQKTYAPLPNAKIPWPGYLVTPRMQMIWKAAVDLTRFKDVSEVKEAHVLMAMMSDSKTIASQWVEKENYWIHNGEEILSYISNELNIEVSAVVAMPPESGAAYAAQPEAKEEKKSGFVNPFKIISKGTSIGDLFKKKAPKPVEEISYDEGWGDEPSAAPEMMETQEVSSNLPEQQPPQEDIKEIVSKEMITEEPQPPSEPEPVIFGENILPDDEKEPPSTIETESITQAPEEEPEPEEITPSVSGTKSIKVGEQIIYVDGGLIGSGIPENILNRLAEISEQYGALPEKFPLKGVRVTFEGFLGSGLTEDDCESVIKEITDFMKVDISRSQIKRVTGSGRLRPEVGSRVLGASTPETGPSKDSSDLGNSSLKLSSEEISSAIDDADSLSIDDDNSEEVEGAIVKVELSTDSSDSNNLQEKGKSEGESKGKVEEAHGSEKQDDSAKPAEATLADASKRKVLPKTLLGEFGVTSLPSIPTIELPNVLNFTDFTLQTGIKDRIEISELLTASGSCYTKCDIDISCGSFQWSDISDYTFEHIVKSGERTNQVTFDSYNVVIGNKN